MPRQLADAARTRARSHMDLLFPYHPHVTVAHHLREDPVLDRAFDDLAAFECLFDADRFHLYAHDPEAAAWQPTREFALQKVDGAG